MQYVEGCVLSLTFPSLPFPCRPFQSSAATVLSLNQQSECRVLIPYLTALCSSQRKPLNRLEICADTNLETNKRLALRTAQCCTAGDMSSQQSTQKPHSLTHPPTLLFSSPNPIQFISFINGSASLRQGLQPQPTPLPPHLHIPLPLLLLLPLRAHRVRSLRVLARPLRRGRCQSSPQQPPGAPPTPIAFSRRSVFPRPTAEGILAALPSSSSSVAASLSSSPSSSSSSPSSSSARMIPPIPKPRREFPQPPQYQSAPVNVPVVPSRFKNRKGSILLEEEEEKSNEEEEEMLPPHEIVARARAKELPMTTFSVLEGAGRTLKGRDLRQVRNAVWRKTGFLD